MKKDLIINEQQLREIIREEITKMLAEDITLNKQDGKRSISVNDDNTNPKYVDTNNHASPYIFKDTQRGYTVYSIFQRQKTEDDSTDANPILNALKQKKGWEFANAKKDLMKLLRNFVAAVKLLPKYDTIIMTPSNNDLNKIVFSYLIRLIPHANSYENFFEKYTAEDVYNNLIDDAYINKHFENPQKVYNSIDEAFGNMMKNNNGIFSYRCLLKTPYREAIIQSMKVNLGVDNDLNYDEAINGKNVLIFDDTVTTGKTISDSGRAIYEMFAPNTLTYVTLFSALNTNDGTQEKIQKV